MEDRSTRPNPITSIAVEGFKSLAERSAIELRPLTLLAGANSSGKSSIMQPVLLLKQTLEAPYDPGPLLLSDSHVRFTSADQLLSKIAGQRSAKEFAVEVAVRGEVSVESAFRQREGRQDLELVKTRHRHGNLSYELTVPMNHGEVLDVLSRIVRSTDEKVPRSHLMRDLDTAVRGGRVRRLRCFLEFEMDLLFWDLFLSDIETTSEVASAVEEIVHVPGLRGNPERTYKTSAVATAFAGTFENYVASVISLWQAQNDERLERLGSALRSLGLTWKVQAKPLDAIQAEIQVARLPQRRRGGAQDLVNIADVGFGVSQSLPVVVALLTAGPGQLVYLEQPEIHLHPRAQVALAELLVEAAERGVIVVAETHSALLLLAVQTRVAQGRIDPDLVRLHWFRRGDDGTTEITSGKLDQSGAYGDWPEDFGAVILEAESRYLDAAEAALAHR
jgi:predicted ATPase